MRGDDRRRQTCSRARCIAGEKPMLGGSSQLQLLLTVLNRHSGPTLCVLFVEVKRKEQHKDAEEELIAETAENIEHISVRGVRLQVELKDHNNSVAYVGVSDAAVRASFTSQSRDKNKKRKKKFCSSNNFNTPPVARCFCKSESHVELSSAFVASSAARNSCIALAYCCLALLSFSSILGSGTDSGCFDEPMSSISNASPMMLQYSVSNSSSMVLRSRSTLDRRRQSYSWHYRRQGLLAPSLYHGIS